jgi:hypothetical protein
MKSKKYTNIVFATLLALTSATAFSGAQADTILYICQYCNQIKPIALCLSTTEDPDILTFCGSETWDRSGTTDCKRFYRVVRHCANGSIQTYTIEKWAGAGSFCNPGADATDHDCN